MMKKIFALVLMLVLGKISYSQYPLQQNLGSDSTIVISKGATQSRFVNIVFTDTTQANTQRIKNYPGAQIATNGGGIKLWLRNQTATAWIPVNTGSGNNIYTIDGTLTGNRTLTGGGYPLTFTGLDKFVVSADSIRFTTGDLNLGLNTDSASLTKKISYSGNYRGDYKQFTLVDKGYVDSVVASSPAGTVTSIATNNGSGITGGTITSTGTLAIDTTNVISTKANVASGLAGKLNISDTAAMLAPYLRAIDTTSLSNRINLKLNISDTASMLGNYLNNVGYGLSKAGQVVSADSATLSNYYLRRKDSLTTTNPLGYVTKQILADTAAAIRSADAGGTVTSVGLTMPAAFNVGNSPITTAGTISVTAAGLVSQYIRGDGTLADFPGGGGGGGASISYYLNGSVNQGTFGGNTYYEMNKTPIFGTGTNFSINADGYIAQFITDAGDPGLLKIPGGNWNFELFFNASSGGGTPTYYVELYKYDGTTFTLIASGSSNPDVITGGTSVEAYFSTLPVPETVLTLTDRLAVRIYVTHAGRTITLHTEDNNLCQVITTFTTGITALNGLTEQVQYFTTGTSGTDFNISSSVATHTFNLPTASATNRGALSTTDWTTFNNKVGGSLISGYIPKATGTNTIDTSQLFQDGQNVGIGTLTPNGRLAIVDTGGFALKINYNSASNVSDSNAAIYAENNGLSSYVAIFNEKTTNNTGAQLPLLIESSLTTGTPQANMGTGLDFGTRDDANNRKLNRFIVRGTDPAAATYTSRAEFRLWNNGVQTTPYYWLGNGNMGLGTSTPDSNLTVVNGAYFQRGIRASGLPAAPGTKALRIDASGTLSYADTLIDAGGTVTSIASNNGTGITGGTITTTGTLAIDTLLISTRAWRQKGVDSVAALVNSNVSGTTNRVSKFTGANTIGNSSIADSSSSVAMTILSNGNIGINTTAPNERLEIVGTSRFTRTTSPSVYLNISMENGFAEYDARGSIDHVWENGGVENMRLALGGNLGIGTASPDSMLTVLQGARFQRGVRMSGLPTAPGTRALRIDANGTLSVADTTTGGGGIGGSGTTNRIAKFTASGTIGNSSIADSSSSVAMTISSAGAVIFTDTVRINTTSTKGLVLQNSAGGESPNITFNTPVNKYNIDANAVGNLRLFTEKTDGTGGVVRATLDSSGNLGLGTTTIGSRLQVNGNAAIGYSASTAAPTNGLAVSGLVGIGTNSVTISQIGQGMQIGDNTSNAGIRFNVISTGIGYIEYYQGTTAKYLTGYRDSNNSYNIRTGTSFTAGNGITLLSTGQTDIGSSTSFLKIIPAWNAGTGTWLDISTDGASAIGSGGAGVNPWVAYAASATQWFTASTTGDICYRNTAGKLLFGNSTTFAMAITGGNVGIATTTIGSKFQVNGNAAIGYSASTAAPTNGLAVSGTFLVGTTDATNTDKARINNDGTNVYSTIRMTNANSTANMYVGVGGSAVANTALRNNAYVWNAAATALAFGTSDVEAMRITSGGASASVGIGTSTIGSKLQVNGNAAIGYSASTAAPTNGLAVAGNISIGQSSNAYALDALNTGASTARISITGTTNFAVLQAVNTGGTFYLGIDDSGGSNFTGTSYGRLLYSTGAYPLALFTNGVARMTLTSGGQVTLATGANVSAIAQTGYSLTGSNAQSLIDLAGTWNTTGNPTAIKLNITNTASGASAYLMDLQVGGTTQFRVAKDGAIRTTAPTGGTADNWKFGTKVASSVVFDDNDYLEVEVGGTLYRVALVNLAEPEPDPEPLTTPDDRIFREPVRVKAISQSDNQKIKDLEKELAELKEMIKSIKK